MDLNAFAVATLSQAADNRDKASGGEAVLTPFSANSSKQAYVAEATRLASARGIDPELAAGLASGIADSETGKTCSLDETRANIDAALKSRSSASPAGKP